MKGIFAKKAEIWCERLSRIMKEKGYTQKTFLKEYKERYGGGTQANVSRWHRVGSKIEGEKIIGFPSFETMSNIADLLGVSVGYLTGETDFESFDMERTCKFMGIDEDTVKAIKGITSGQSVRPFGKYTAPEYTAVLKYLLTAKSFPEFVKEIREYADNIYHQVNPIDYMELTAKQINKCIIDLAIQCLDYHCNSDEQYGEYDDFKENNVEPTDELLEAIRLLQHARDRNYAEEEVSDQRVKLSEYGLQKKYFDLIKEIVIEEHLPDMTIPRYEEDKLIEYKQNK